MVRHPAKQTYDTVTHLNKDAAPLSTTQLTKYVTLNTEKQNGRSVNISSISRFTPICECLTEYRRVVLTRNASLFVR